MTLLYTTITICYQRMAFVGKKLTNLILYAFYLVAILSLSISYTVYVSSFFPGMIFYESCHIFAITDLKDIECMLSNAIKIIFHVIIFIIPVPYGVYYLCARFLRSFQLVNMIIKCIDDSSITNQKLGISRFSGCKYHIRCCFIIYRRWNSIKPFS